MNYSKSIALGLTGFSILLPSFAAHGNTAFPMCPGLAPVGSEIKNPPVLNSVGGKLSVHLVARNHRDKDGNERYCFVAKVDGEQSRNVSMPTLEVSRGDTLEVTVANGLTAFDKKGLALGEAQPYGFAGACGPSGGLANNLYATNLHFHGLNVSPRCEGDESISKLLNASLPNKRKSATPETLKYSLKIPNDDPSGLNWYHPHVHGLTESHVSGGASGAIIVRGIEQSSKATQGLIERVVVLRDMALQNPRALSSKSVQTASLTYSALRGLEPIASSLADLKKLRNATVLEIGLADVISLSEVAELLKHARTGANASEALLAPGSMRSVPVTLPLVQSKRNGKAGYFVKLNADTDNDLKSKVPGQKLLPIKSALAMVPAKDVSVNDVPVLWNPTAQGGAFTTPGVIKSALGKREFWRVANASAGSYFKLQLRSRSEAGIASKLPLQLIGLDGIPIGVATGHLINAAGVVERGLDLITLEEILLPPGGRAEFIVSMPKEPGSKLELISAEYDTQADWNPTRILASVRLDKRLSQEEIKEANLSELERSQPTNKEAGTRFLRPYDQPETKSTAIPSTTLYFSQKDENDKTQFFFDPSFPDPASKPSGASETRKLYSVSNTPIVKAFVGTRPIWKIVNADYEAHAFHIHQIRFKVLARNGRLPNLLEQSTLRDTIDLEPCSKTIVGAAMKEQCPSLLLEMDFSKGDIVGNFPLHCHILEHEDGGMMAIMSVLPATTAKLSKSQKLAALVDSSTAVCRSPALNAKMNAVPRKVKRKEIVVVSTR
jgi:FtsP/CotA-like multicopper oxidase with cupredoxin domain